MNCKRIFDSCVPLFSYQCSLLFLTTLIFYHIVLSLSRTFLFSFLLFYTTQLDYHIFFRLSTTFSSSCEEKRRKRDLNPRAAINDLLPFQGSPFSLLGISPAEYMLYSVDRSLGSEAERVGFEPTRPCGQTVFKTASLWPLRYLSSYITVVL